MASMHYYYSQQNDEASNIIFTVSKMTKQMINAIRRHLPWKMSAEDVGELHINSAFLSTTSSVEDVGELP